MTQVAHGATLASPVTNGMLTQVETLCQIKGMAKSGELFETLELEQALPAAPFWELHRRHVDMPIDAVWDSTLDVTGSEVRTLMPLFVLRGLPARLMGKRPPLPTGDKPLLDLFVDEGFTLLRKDPHPVDGRAVLLFGAVGKFWAVAHNTPMVFETAADFLDFNEEGYAKTVCRVEAISQQGQTLLETETLIAGTDAGSNKKFKPYWMLIRGPSGLIRRSWLAAIDRKAHNRAGGAPLLTEG